MEPARDIGAGLGFLRVWKPKLFEFRYAENKQSPDAILVDYSLIM